MLNKRMTLKYPLWVKGKGMPKDGVCLFRQGEEVNLVSENGRDYYILAFYKGKQIRVATIVDAMLEPIS